MGLHILAGKGSERAADLQHVNQPADLRGLDRDIRLDASSAAHLPAGIGMKYAGSGLGRDVERAAVERLLQGAPAGRVVKRDGQRQTGVARKRKYILYDAFAVAGFAENSGAVMVLQRAG